AATRPPRRARPRSRARGRAPRTPRRTRRWRARPWHPTRGCHRRARRTARPHAATTLGASQRSATRTRERACRICGSVNARKLYCPLTEMSGRGDESEGSWNASATMIAMADPAQRIPTYDDVLAAPAHKIAEIVGGALHVSPRPATPHAVAASVLGGELGGAFGRGRGGP